MSISQSIILFITTILIVGSITETIIVESKVFPYIPSKGFIVKQYEHLDCTGNVNHIMHVDHNAGAVCVLPFSFYLHCDKSSHTCQFGFNCSCPEEECTWPLSVGDCYLGYKLFYEPIDYYDKDWCIISTIKTVDDDPDFCSSRPDAFLLSKKDACSTITKYHFEGDFVYNVTLKVECNLHSLTVSLDCDEDTCGNCQANQTVQAFFCYDGIAGQSNFSSIIGDYWWWKRPYRSEERIR